MPPRAEDETPGQAGFRWPAEWEPHRATWLSWPHNEETWPGRLAEVEAAFVRLVAALDGRERVEIAVEGPAREEHVRGLLRDAGVEDAAGFHHAPTDDAWVRDHGPVFVVGAADELACVDFGFDAWGGKYPPWDRDAAIPAYVASALGVRRFEADFVLEGGSVDGDGEGTVLTTTSCLLHPNRRRPGEPPRTREGMEARLHAWLGADRVLWLGDGIVGDDTDGHVDDFARFVAPAVVVAAEEPDAGDPNHAPLAANLGRLRGALDARGRRLVVATVPMPPPVVVDGVRCPASYANFLLANGVALVPVFDVPSDRRALDVLRELLPGRDIVGIPSRALVAGLGAVHCLTQQEPGVSAEADEGAAGGTR